MSVKNWNFTKIDNILAKTLAQECGISQMVAEILVSRGITSYAQADAFLNDEQVLEDPFSLIDMDRAVQRISRALEQDEPIVVYGDYDCDGVTSTAILYSYLSMLGAQVSYYIPKRETEGYGLNREAIGRLAEQGASLIITVDNGISALDEIRYANELGLTVIVTDHHQVGEELPEAYAVVDPHRPDCPSEFKYLAGVGVAFKLVTALENGDYDSTLEQFSDLLAIGTIGDIVPLVGENRTLVRIGLEAVAHTDNIGLAALMETAGISPQKLTAQNVAFGIVPRINAAGRMKDAAIAAELLLCDDPERAQILAQEVDALNQKRRSLEDGIMRDIEVMIAENPSLLNNRVLALYHEDWHPGIIGIVASKVLERYGKPVLLMSAENGQLRGSARSVEFFSLYQMLTACEKTLTQYGGHTQAAGFSLPEANFTEFYRDIEAYARKEYPVMPAFSYEVDRVLPPQELGLEQIRELSVLEPFGAANQVPLFCIKKAVLRGISPVSENRHLRLKMQYGGMEITAMYFGMSTDRFLFRVGETLDFLCNISINPYNGREYLSVMIKDIRPSGFEQKKFFNAKAYYEMYRRDEEITPQIRHRMIPNRDQTAVVYKYLRKCGAYTGEVELLYSAFPMLNYCQYRVILDVLEELGLIRVSPLLDRIDLCDCDHKVDLEAAPTLRRLKGS